MAAAAFAFFNAIYGLFVLPESLTPENRRRFEWQRANPRGAFKNLVNHSVLADLATAFALVYIGQKAVEYLLSFFITEKFHWSLSKISTLGIYIGALVVSIQGGLIRWVIPKLGLNRSIIYGLCFYAIGLLLIAFFTYNGYLLYAYMVPYCLGGISSGALQGLITSKVGPREQGELQGSLSSINSVSIVIGPLLMSYIFHYFTSKTAVMYFPGAPYLFGAILMIISVFIVINSFNKEKVHK
jgi:DHA1 family tetracycline resistance protein-like MFS transporter